MAEEHHHKEEVHHEHHKTSLSDAIKKFGTWKFISIILVVLLLLCIYTNGFKLNVGKDKVANNVVEYINTYLLAGQGITATSEGITEENGLYKIKLNVGGKSFDSYVTKDGSLLFPSVVDMTQKIETGSTETPQEIPKTNVPDVKLYIMSYCPYGIQAMNTIAPVVDLLKDVVKVGYVVYANYQGGGADYCIEDGKYCSMHGVQELNEDIRQLCIQKYQKDKFWSYYAAVSTKCTYQNVDTCWEALAKSSGVDTIKVKSCASKEGVSLIKAEYDANQENGVSGSPTLIINGVQYSGGRTSQGYKDAICGAYNKEPSACSQELKATGQATAATTGGCG